MAHVGVDDVVVFAVTAKHVNAPEVARVIPHHQILARMRDERQPPAIAPIPTSRSDLQLARRSSRHPETASAVNQRAGSTCDPSDRGEISGSPQDDHLWAERGNPHSMPSRLTEAGFS